MPIRVQKKDELVGARARAYRKIELFRLTPFAAPPLPKKLVVWNGLLLQKYIRNLFFFDDSYPHLKNGCRIVCFEARPAQLIWLLA